MTINKLKNPLEFSVNGILSTVDQSTIELNVIRGLWESPLTVLFRDCAVNPVLKASCVLYTLRFSVRDFLALAKNLVI